MKVRVFVLIQRPRVEKLVRFRVEKRKSFRSRIGFARILNDVVRIRSRFVRMMPE